MEIGTLLRSMKSVISTVSRKQYKDLTQFFLRRVNLERRYTKLRNGVIFDLNLLQTIVRKDQDQFIIVLEGCQATPLCNQADYDAIEKLLEPETTGVVEVVKQGLVVPV